MPLAFYEGLTPMSNDDTPREQSRAPIPAPRPLWDGDDVGKVRRPPDPFDKPFDPRKPDNPLEQFAKGEPRLSSDEAIKHKLQEEAAAVIERSMAAIVDNINVLIERANRLKTSIIEDTAEVKSRINANLNHGAKILDLAKRMNSELDELENLHRSIIKGKV